MPSESPRRGTAYDHERDRPTCGRPSPLVLGQPPHRQAHPHRASTCKGFPVTFEERSDALRALLIQDIADDEALLAAGQATLEDVGLTAMAEILENNLRTRWRIHVNRMTVYGRDQPNRFAPLTVAPIEVDFAERPEPVPVEVGFNSHWGMEEWDDHRLFVNRFERNAMLTHQILREDQMRLYPDVTIRDTSGFGTVMVTPGVLQPPVLPRPEFWGAPC
jgi:hypothetical protein